VLLEHSYCFKRVEGLGEVTVVALSKTKRVQFVGAFD
jgi:hypothetical protein